MSMSRLFADFQMKCENFVKEMKGANHHFDSQHLNKYHLESDVFTHTSQVCLMAEVFKVNHLVQLACLFHDLGKPLAREEIPEQFKTRFVGHEGLSVFLTLDAINQMDLQLNDKDLSLLLNMISLHTVIFQTTASLDYKKKILAKFRGNKTLLDHLILLAKCDSMGRFAEEKADLLALDEKILPLLGELTDGVTERTDFTNTMTLLIGPPLSGKTTWIKDHAGDAIVLSRDDIINQVGKQSTYRENWELVDQKEIDSELHRQRNELILAKKDIIVDMTHCSLRSRRSAMGQTPKHYKKRAIIFYTAYSELMRRNIERSDLNGKYIHESSIQAIMKSFIVPLYHEFDEIVEIFNR
jgi:predicted kinase